MQKNTTKFLTYSDRYDTDLQIVAGNFDIFIPNFKPETYAEYG